MKCQNCQLLMYVKPTITHESFEHDMLYLLIQGSPLGKFFISQLATGYLFLVASAIFWEPVGYWDFCFGRQCHFWSPKYFTP